MNLHRRILIVENSRYVSFALRRELLKRWPNDLITVINHPCRALDELNQSIYHAVLVDLESILPYQTNGHKFVQDLRLVDEQVLVMVIAAAELAGSRKMLYDRLGISEADHRLSIIDKDDHTPLAVPGLLYRLLPKPEELADRNEGSVADVASMSLSDRLGHELNNPLMAIMGTVELLQERSDCQSIEMSHKLGIIRDSAQRIDTSLKRIRSDIRRFDRPHARLSNLSEVDLMAENWLK